MSNPCSSTIARRRACLPRHAGTVYAAGPPGDRRFRRGTGRAAPAQRPGTTPGTSTTLMTTNASQPSLSSPRQNARQQRRATQPAPAARDPLTSGQTRSDLTTRQRVKEQLLTKSVFSQLRALINDQRMYTTLYLPVRPGKRADLGKQTSRRSRRCSSAQFEARSGRFRSDACSTFAPPRTVKEVMS